MVFITAGMGGGTGTGGAPVVARIVRELGTLAITVVTKPFRFEGESRAKIADRGIETLRDKVDTLLVIPNQRLYTELDPETRLKDGFEKADEVLKQAVQSISDVITTEGYINVDFADVRSIMKDAGRAVMGVGQARGSRRAVEAANIAITSPLLEDVSIQGALGLLVNITGNEDLTMRELDEVMDVITGAVSQEVRTFYGQVFDNTLQDEVRVTVIATGLSQGEKAVDHIVQGRDYAGRTKMFVSRQPRNDVPGGPSKTPAYLRKGVKVKFEEPVEESDK
jgi:cell division protein FtsZ